MFFVFMSLLLIFVSMLFVDWFLSISIVFHVVVVLFPCFVSFDVK